MYLPQISAIMINHTRKPAYKVLQPLIQRLLRCRVLDFDELGAISGDPLACVIRSLVKYVTAFLSAYSFILQPFDEPSVSMQPPFPASSAAVEMQGELVLDKSIGAPHNASLPCKATGG